MPTALVGLTPERANDTFIEVTTAGVAAGHDVDSATEHALFELIERDAMMRTWMSGDDFRKIAASDGLRDLLPPETPGWRTDLLAVPSPFGPLVALVASFNQDRCLFAIGSSWQRERASR